MTVEDITTVVATAKASVVTITADGLSAGGFSPFQVPTTGVGSGVILTSDGYILTNHHVVAGSTTLTVKLADGREFPATLIRTSSTTDLSLIKINATGLPAASIGDSAAIAVGQVGDRDRQPARDLHRDRHQGHRFGPRPRDHRERPGDPDPGSAPRAHPDRRGDQPRQQRRAAARQRRERPRHRHGGREQRRGPRLRDPDLGRGTTSSTWPTSARRPDHFRPKFQAGASTRPT